MSPFVVNRPRRCAGFSLLEVLVAFAILSLTLGVILAIFSGGLRNLGQSQSYTEAMLNAQSKLAEIGVTTPLVPGEQQGRIDGNRYRWAAQITAVALQPALRVALYRIHLTVSWGSGADQRAVALDTLRIGPATP